MKKLLYLSLLAPLFFSCTSEKGNSAGGQFTTTKVVDQVLAEKYIFQMDSSYNAWQRVTKDQATKARQLFLKGLNQYVNEKNAAEGARIFRESILYNPLYTTYTYLANAYIDMGDTVRADSVLVDYEPPDGDRWYAHARRYAIRKDTMMAITSLTECFGYGSLNRKKLENDRIFDFLRSHPRYEVLVVTYLKDDAKLQTAFFKRYLATAPDIALPFSFTRDSISATQGGQGLQLYIDYDFAAFVPGMEDSRFSRDVSNSYYMVGKLKLDNGLYAVLYKSVMAIMDTLPSVEVNIAVFDSIGGLIEAKPLAKYELPETLMTGTIDENKVISTMQYKIKWKTDPLQNGYAGNEYLGEEFVSENKFAIGAGGIFVNHVDDKNAVTKQ